MTCIVGMVDRKEVYIGGDNVGCNNSIRQSRVDNKVFRKGNMIFGFTTSYRMGQLIRYKLDIPEFRSDKKSIEEYMYTEFIDAVRKTLKEGGFAKINNGEESGGTFLVGFSGRLFEVSDDFQILEPADKFYSCGSGMYYALGALHILKEDRSMPAEDKIKKALEAAEYYNPYVRRPFDIIKI